MPSPLAVAVYAAVKVAGYSYFAKGLNAAAGKAVQPLSFGLGKTVIGLFGGMVYVFLIIPTVTPLDGSDLLAFIGAAPIRVVAWIAALGVFYGYGLGIRMLALAVVAGTAWSYILDGVTWVLYRFVPGMVMPFC